MRHVVSSRTASATLPMTARFWSVEYFVICLSLLPSAAERSVQIHHRLQMQKLNLDQFIPSREQSVFGVEDGEDVHGPGRHLRLCELKCTARLFHRFLLSSLLLLGLLSRHQRAFDIAERGYHRLVVIAQQFPIAGIVEHNLSA